MATTPARWQRVVAALPELSWSDDYGATWHRSGPRATIVASDPRNERIWYAVAPDGELLVSTDGGRSLVSAALVYFTVSVSTMPSALWGAQ